MYDISLTVDSCVFLCFSVYCKTGSVSKPRNGTVKMFVKFGDSMVNVDSKTLVFMYKVWTHENIVVVFTIFYANTSTSLSKMDGEICISYILIDI